MLPSATPDRSDGREADGRERWSRPLSSLLAVALVAMIVAVSGVLVQIDYRRDRAAAIAGADDAMAALSAQLVDRFAAIAANALMPVTLVSRLALVFLTPPPDALDVKMNIAREGLAQAPPLDGIYVGYPDGAFFHAIRLASPAWREALGAPSGATLAVRTLTATGPDRRQELIFLDGAGKTVAERRPPASKYDPRLRPWYQSGRDAAQPVSIGPYRMATTGALGLAIAQSHVGNPQIVVGADVVIDTILDFLHDEKITPGTVIFIADGAGKVVIHSDPAMMRRIDARREGKPAEPVADDPLERNLLDADFTDHPIQIAGGGGRRYLATARPLGDGPLLAGHRVYIAAPMDELLAQANAALRQSLFVSAAVIAAAIALALFLARLIARSLNALTSSAGRLQNLDFTTPIHVPTRVREIRALGGAMNRARDAIHNFTLYVPREFVRKGLETGHFSGRSARRQEVTALFTDIYDFTTISENSAPEDVVAMLSDYFDIFSEVVCAHNGTIIQFLGDSVFAMWNAPVADALHAEHACRCALAVEDRLKAFNAAQALEGLPQFRTRYGIHTGQALVGSVGARERLQYTAMGDTINLASRLEGINKEHRTQILASAATVAQCGDAVCFRPLGATRAKGRAAKVELFEVTGARHDPA